MLQPSVQWAHENHTTGLIRQNKNKQTENEVSTAC